MATTTVEVKGLKELGARLKALDQDMHGKIGRATTNAGAQVIKKRIKQLAPVAPGPYKIEGVVVQPGNIAKNVITKYLGPGVSRYTSEHIIAVRGKRKDGYANRVAIFNEFGTVKQAPHSFFRVAFEQEKQNAVAAMKKKLTQRIMKAEKGGV